jgi:hypothetical protein
MKAMALTSPALARSKRKVCLLGSIARPSTARNEQPERLIVRVVSEVSSANAPR